MRPSRPGPLLLVVGCGSIGKRHISNLLALEAGALVAFDPDAARRDEVQERFGIQTVESLGDAWRLGPLAALIAAPTSLHVQVALEAARHGCHLFIEKPLSDTVEAVDDLVQTIRDKDLTSLVGCNMRFHPALVEVKRLLEEQAIGRVVAARVQFGQYLPDWHPWEDYRHGYSARRDLGGGVILDAIHEIDFVRWMLGEVVSASCFAGKLSELEIDTEDTAAILLRFESGAIGELHLDYIQRTYSRSCQVVGDEGTIWWDHGEARVRCRTASQDQELVLEQPSDWTSNDMYVAEMRHFLACLAGDERPQLDVQEAKRVLEIALACKRSAEAERVVHLAR